MTSKREDVLAAVQAAFEAPATAPDYGTVWSRVLDSPPDGRERVGQTILSVLEGLETYDETISPDKLGRRIDIELRCLTYVPRGTTLRRGANNVLADMEQVVAANYHWNGTAINTAFLSNDVLREDTNDRVVEISLFIAVRYRSKRSNPSSL